MNPTNIIQLMQSGNRQQIIQNMIGNNQIMSNPLAQNAVNLVKSGDSKGIEQMARNLCKEKGMNPDQIMNQLKTNFRM